MDDDLCANEACIVSIGMFYLYFLFLFSCFLIKLNFNNLF